MSLEAEPAGILFPADCVAGNDRVMQYRPAIPAGRQPTDKRCRPHPPGSPDIAGAIMASESDRPHAVDACELHAQESQRLQPDRLTLTDAERFVLREVMDIYAGEDDVASNEIAAVIDRLLERTRC
jgi:hypothetical protein